MTRGHYTISSERMSSREAAHEVGSSTTWLGIKYMLSVHPIGMSEQMDLGPLRSTMEHLYEGEQNAIGITLSSEIEFHDPLVVVRGTPRVMTMFRRLNRLFPQSKIHTFRPLNDGGLLASVSTIAVVTPRPLRWFTPKLN